MYKFITIENSEAKCLDGTSPGFYWRKGKDPSKFLIYFNGGGVCGSKIFKF